MDQEDWRLQPPPKRDQSSIIGDLEGPLLVDVGFIYTLFIPCGPTVRGSDFRGSSLTGIPAQHTGSLVAGQILFQTIPVQR